MYLDRTQGVSSTELRSQKRLVKLGLVGDTGIFEKYRQEAAFANGVEVVAAYTEDVALKQRDNDIVFTNDYGKLLETVDAVFIVSHPSKHYEQIKRHCWKGNMCYVSLQLH